MNPKTNWCLILPDEYEALLQKKQDLHEQMNEIGKVIWDVTTQSGETWHDNAWFDEAMRLMSVLMARNEEVNQVVNNARIYQFDEKNEKVQIGSKVLIKQNDMEKEIRLWGSFTIPWRVSYISPLWETLLWAQPWENRTMVLKNKKHIITILQIRND
jgi:transcription elongation GreA/GreB family factor